MRAFKSHRLVFALCCVVPPLHLGTWAMVCASSTASKCLFPRTLRGCLPLPSAGLWAACVGADWSSTGTTTVTPSWAWYMAPDTPLCCWPSGERRAWGAGWICSRVLGSALTLVVPSHCVLPALGSPSCALSLSLLGLMSLVAQAVPDCHMIPASCQVPGQARPACLPSVSITPAMVHCTS